MELRRWNRQDIIKKIKEGMMGVEAVHSTTNLFTEMLFLKSELISLLSP